MEKNNTKGVATIQTEQQAFQSGFIITRRRRAVDSVEVLISELRNVGSANFQFTLYAWLDGIAIGLLISVGITLVTVPFSEKQVIMYAGFLVLLGVSAFAFLTFTILAIIFGIKSKQQINEILANEKLDVEEQINIPKNSIMN